MSPSVKNLYLGGLAQDCKIIIRNLGSCVMICVENKKEKKSQKHFKFPGSI